MLSLFSIMQNLCKTPFMNTVAKTLYFLFLSWVFFNCSPEERSHPLPSLLYADADILFELKSEYAEGENTHELVEHLIACAEAKLSLGPFSVMQKDIVPPSGDKHDYISQGPYWWPDTTKPDGLPYIRRDGVPNPEREKFTDRQHLHDLIETTDILSKAYYVTDNETYAQRAAYLLQVWFADDSTRMNPHLEFGQGIPGRTEGRGIGIIETRSIGKIADVVSILRNSTHWSQALDEALREWMDDYLTWLTTSEKGKDEAVHPNNHGTWYDVQTLSLALFLGYDSLATQIAENAKKSRLDAHIMQDGAQPEELARTISFTYSAMNLQGLFHLAYLAEKAHVDLWNYENTQGAQLIDALAFLLPAATGQAVWKHKQIRPIQESSLFFHLNLAKKKYDPKYEQLANAQKPVIHAGNCDHIDSFFY